MIDPKTVLLSIPSHTGSISCELAGMLINYGHRYFGGLTMPTECSHPSLVRNIIADTFWRSPFQWLVGIDSDIVPRPEDFAFLLQERDESTLYAEDVLNPSHSVLTGQVPPLPTRIESKTMVDDTGQSSNSLCDVLVNCEYAYKREPFEPVQFGLGFYRVHRSVFSMLQQLKHAPGDTVEVSRSAFTALHEYHKQKGDYHPWELIEELVLSLQDPVGAPRLWQTMHQGRMLYDYYPSGPLIDQHVPCGQWMGEDHGFWTLCRLAGLVPRIERRTQLIHIGRKGYLYEGES